MLGGVGRFVLAAGLFIATTVITAAAETTTQPLSSRATSITAANGYTCAVTGAGAAKCWGRNDLGQLGNGTRRSRSIPAAVHQLARGVVALSAGGHHACALTRAGAVKCWGFNRFGQLGDGTTWDDHRLTPVGVVGLGSGASAIAAGHAHTCALTSAGGVKCWGGNGSGQLGDATQANRRTPVDVWGLASGVAAIAAGFDHTCALTRSGAVKCWGANWSGQLGNGSGYEWQTPVDVLGLTRGVLAIAAGGAHTCALTSGGAVKCWGANWSGQLGDGTTTDRPTPVAVSGLTHGVVAIAAGLSHTCALISTGAVKCWGWNAYGQLGDGTMKQRLTPGPVAELGRGAAALTAGSKHTCALTSTGVVKCWGAGRFGQLGDGAGVRRLTPVAVVGFGGTLKCFVPYVVHLPLARAKASIVDAHCRVGKVTRVASRKPQGTVIREWPRPGEIREKGTRIRLDVAR